MTDSSHSHLAPKIRDKLTLPPKDRIQIMKRDVFVPYPLATTALEYMDDLVNSPINDRPDNFMLTGMPGSGKTSVISRWQKIFDSPPNGNPTGAVIVSSIPGGGKTALMEQVVLRNPQFSTPPVDIKPVIRITVPAGGRADLITELLGSLGYDPERSAGLASIRQARVYNGLDQCKTRVLILDDINNLKENRSGKISTAAWETLKFIRVLSDKLRIHIIFTGDEASAEIVDQEDSLRTRMQKVELEPWTDGEELARLLQGVEATLPLAEASNIGERSRTSLVFKLGQQADRDGRAGRLYYLVKIPKKAGELALKRGLEHIENVDLEKAAEWYGRRAS